MRRRTAATFVALVALMVGGLTAQSAFASSVMVTNPGGGRVTSTVGTLPNSPNVAASIDCWNSDDEYQHCSVRWDAGKSITLTASPDAGKRIVAWTGYCAFAATARTCTFTMPTGPSVTAGVSFEVDPNYDTWPTCLLVGANVVCTPNCAVGRIRGDGHQYFSAGGEVLGCRAASRSGMMSIGGHKIHSYTLGDRTGNLPPRHICYWRSSGAVWPSVGASEWSTTITAYNSVGSTRHWAWGVEFESPTVNGPGPASGFGDGCVSHEGCVSNALSNGGCPDGDGIILVDLVKNAVVGTQAERGARQAGAVPPADPAAVSPPVSASEAAARADEEARLTLVGGRADRPGVHRLACPTGTEMLHADTAIVGAARGAAVEEPFVDHTLHVALFTITAVPRGAHVRLQVVCRTAGAGTHTATGGHIHGSSRSEVHRTSQAGQHVRAGGGHDVVHATHRNGFVIGGTGNDRIIIRANGVQAMGGPGRDRIESYAAGASHMEGNAGSDTLVSHRGRTTINAEDGAPGDLIICDPGSRATVFMDKGDSVRGACRVLHRR